MKYGYMFIWKRQRIDLPARFISVCQSSIHGITVAEMRMAKHKACLQIYEERLMFFKITARWKGCFHGITVAEIRMAKHKACLQIHEGVMSRMSKCMFYMFPAQINDHRDHNHPSAWKWLWSRLRHGFNVGVNIAGIDPVLSSEQTVLLEVFIQLPEHNAGSCASNRLISD